MGLAKERIGNLLAIVSTLRNITMFGWFRELRIWVSERSL